MTLLHEVIPGYTTAADAAKYLDLQEMSRIRRLALDGRITWKWLDETTKRIRLIDIDSLLKYKEERDAYMDARKAAGERRKAKQKR